MFTQRNTENERGALMIEAIALLGLMTMMSPMVVRQTAERTSEMEEVAVAGQMKELKNALSNYIEANYGTLTGDKTENTVRTDITPAQLSAFLSPAALENGNFRGNKMIYQNDGASPFRVAAQAECTETKNGATTAVCPSPGNCALGGTTTCNRYRITGIVLSNGTDELDDRRASRIASMIGADGGYMRTNKTNTALNASDADKRKIYGSQGIWEGDTDTFFGEGGVPVDHGGRIAATTVFTTGASGDFLYRTQQDGIPGANSMFTDLDMGANVQNCGSAHQPACKKINNAGGLEVVNGRILVRSRNNNVPMNNEGGIDAATAISLASDDALINTSRKLSVTTNTILLETSRDENGDPSYNTARISMGAGGGLTASVSTQGGGNTSLSMDGYDMNMHALQGSINMNAGSMYVDVSGDMETNTDYYRMSTRGNDRSGITAWSDAEIEMWSTRKSNSSSGSTSKQGSSRFGLWGGRLRGAIVNGDYEEVMDNDNSDYFDLQKNNFTASVGSGKTTLSLSRGDLSWAHLATGTANSSGYAGLDLYNEEGDGEAVLTAGADAAKLLLIHEGNATLSAKRNAEMIANSTDGQANIRVDDYGEMSGQVIDSDNVSGDFSLTPTDYHLNIANNGRSFFASGGGYVYDEEEEDYSYIDGRIGMSSGSGSQMYLTNGGGYLNTGYVSITANNTEHSSWHGKANITMWSDSEIRITSDNRSGGGTSVSYNGNSGMGFWGSNVRLNAETYEGKGYHINFGQGNIEFRSYENRSNTNGETGRITFAPTGRIVVHEANLYGQNTGSVTQNNYQNWYRVGVNISNEETGEMSHTFSRGWVYANVNAATHSTIAPYAWHYGNCGTNRSADAPEACLPKYQLDLPFISVMNDIVLTSRGGARMSEAMPNYILKGIYTLTNSYTKGKWPCGATGASGSVVSKCQYDMPKYTAEQLGMASGGWEYHCKDGTADNKHPMQGYCHETSLPNDYYGHANGYVTFDYSKEPDGGSSTAYSEECNGPNNACWAHPFIGIVPAPGRGVKPTNNSDYYYGSGTIMAQDELLCPAGYQAVMTVTPTIFELGKISHINTKTFSGQRALSNPGFQNFRDQNMRADVNIMQTGTKLGVVTKPICSLDGNNDCSGANSQLFGWAVAMGTVTQDPTDSNAYIWNVGGLYQNSWQATAHTYCYFNPSRFKMPNMTVKNRDGIDTLTTMSSAWSYVVEPHI